MGLTKPRAAQIFNLDYKQSTRVVTTTNINLSGGAPSLVDGITLSLGDRILVTGQTTGSQNGLYYITTLGSGANGTWARTSDGNENGEIEAGMIVMVTEGIIYADTQWKLITDDPIVINTTALTFTQNYLANSVSSGTSNVVVGNNANVTISSAGTANVLVVSSTGTVTTGTASVTGNVAANYFLGNVACASGIFSSRIFNGTSEANIGASGGNVNVSVGGTSNVAVFATTGQFVSGLLSVTGNVNSGNISATNHTGTNVSVTGTQTAASTVGGVITGSSVSVIGTATSASTVGGVITGSSTSVTGTQTAASTVGGVITGLSTSVTGNITGGNLNTAGNVSTTGNVTGNYLLANIYFATGFSASRIFNGTSEANIGTTSGNANISIGGTSNVVVFSTAGEFVTGLLSVTGNVTGGNILTGGAVSATGNITGGNISATNHTGTVVSVSGNVTGGNVLTGGLMSATGNITGGNISATNYTGTTVSVSGNVAGANIVATTALTNGNITITGANIVSSGQTLTIDPNGSGGTDGNVIITGNLSVQGNVTYINSNNITTNDLTINVANNAATAAAANGGGIGVGPAGSEYISLTYSSSSNVWVASNGLNVQGVTSASGNVTAGNVITGGLISATGNIRGGNILGNGAGLSGINVFSNVTVTGGNSAVADSIADTLTLTAGTGISITVDPATDTITIGAQGGSEIFVDGADFGTVTEPVTLSDNLGLVTEAVDSESDLGTLVTSGLIYPDQLVLPSYTANTLPSAAIAGAMIYVTNETGGPVPAFADGTNWRRVTDRAIVT